MPKPPANLAEQLKPQAMTLRVIIAAMALGVLSMLVVSVMLRGARAAQPVLQFDVITLMGIVFAPIAVVGSRIVPMLMAKAARSRIATGDYATRYSGGSKDFANTEADALAGIYQTTTIVSAAFLEGAAFMNVVAFLLEGSPLALGLSIGLTLGILAMFPSGQRIASWIEYQLRQIEDEKQMGTRREDE